LRVPESGDDLEAVVDGLAAAAALPQYLPVLESSDDVLDAGPNAAVRPLVVVIDGATSLVAARCDDRSDPAMPAIAKNDTTIEQRHHGMASDDGIVAVTGPAAAGDEHAASVSADDDLGVDTAAVVLADGGDGGDHAPGSGCCR
jgi:hypothetical protein